MHADGAFDQRTVCFWRRAFEYFQCGTRCGRRRESVKDEPLLIRIARPMLNPTLLKRSQSLRMFPCSPPRRLSPSSIRRPLLARDAPANSSSDVSAPSGIDGSSASPGTTHHQPRLECIATGDSIVCEIATSSQESTDDEEEPSDAATPSTSSSSLLSTALLIFPFFAWGTSMPALKLVMPHVASPLLLGAIRLVPAGFLLVGWAAATGRKHPSSAQAWLWIALFSLIDGAAFQVRAQHRASHAPMR